MKLSPFVICDATPDSQSSASAASSPRRLASCPPRRRCHLLTPRSRVQRPVRRSTSTHLGDGSAERRSRTGELGRELQGPRTRSRARTVASSARLGASKNSYAKGEGLDAARPADRGPSPRARRTRAPAMPDQQKIGPIDRSTRSRTPRLSVAPLRQSWNPETCVLGSDISRGLGYAADAQLVDTGVRRRTPTPSTLPSPRFRPTPTRSVVQTVARQTMVPNADGTFGLKSTVSQTLAPVTIADSLTIEVAR